MIWALLPLKRFNHAKKRLSSVLTDDERSHLFRVMLDNVLRVLANHPAIERTIIVSDEPSTHLLAERHNVDCWAESSLNINTSPDQRLNAVVDACAERFNAHDVTSMLVVHGDLPLLEASEIQQLLDLHATTSKPALTIAPDKVREGSNCVIATPPNAIPFQYGPDSFNKHQRIADQRSVTTNSVQLAGAQQDIDNPVDLEMLCAVQDSTKLTLAYLHESGIKNRLEYDSLLNNIQGTSNNSKAQLLQLADDAFDSEQHTQKLMAIASEQRDQGFLNTVTYSRKVFIPLTNLCRDVCHYCTFAKTPKKISSPYMSVEEVLSIARAGAKQGCKEALFTLGEKPELRYKVARDALDEMGFESTLHYLAHIAKLVFDETGLLPHINAGCMTDDEIAMLRPVSASMGIMLESSAERLCEKGMPHYGSPDKHPAVRLATIEKAGKANIPFTSGILIGIGETRHERIESLLALRDKHQQYGHLQEIIIQNFRAKEDTKMASSPEPGLDELLWTIAVARIIFGPDMSIQAPPNLSPGVLPKIIDAGINDWGGVSPTTPDFVNPEAPWPHLEQLSQETKLAGKYLHERLTIYPRFAINQRAWLDENLRTAVRRMIDTEGFPRVDNWSPGCSMVPPTEIQQQISATNLQSVSQDVQDIVEQALSGDSITKEHVVRLFRARGDDFSYVCQQADQLRQKTNGDTVSYVVNRNINYTNICYFKCQFCAFSKGKLSEDLRGRPYDLDYNEISRRSQEAWQRGATEVCMQGGIHPQYTGDTYLNILKAVKSATPDMHIHAFSPLEVWQGASTLNLSVTDFLQQLKEAGLNTLPGTAAEILDDEVRSTLCPDKINTEQWLSVMASAHKLGLKTTATIMYGHIEKIEHWARHLLRIRLLQQKTGGFTEFVPLPFVHMEAPIYLKGNSRSGPSYREAVLMHAVARLTLSPYIKNIQTSWVKMGEHGIAACLNAGANDLGGTLMNETITQAAGAKHGQECDPQKMEQLVTATGRPVVQRSTSYGEVSNERKAAARAAVPMVDVINTPAGKKATTKIAS